MLTIEVDALGVSALVGGGLDIRLLLDCKGAQSLVSYIV